MFSFTITNSFPFSVLTNDIKKPITSLPKDHLSQSRYNFNYLDKGFFVWPLTYLFNESIRKGHFPEKFKLLIITPEYKNVKFGISICILSTFFAGFLFYFFLIYDKFPLLRIKFLSFYCYCGKLFFNGTQCHKYFFL